MEYLEIRRETGLRNLRPNQTCCAIFYYCKNAKQS